ncbi:MAG: DUF2249 domain-containing protein [Halanaeroarchaeum sp.]
MFGRTPWLHDTVRKTMEAERIQSVEGVPDDRTPVIVDVRDLPPPEPLTETIDAVGDLDRTEMVVQVNDRVPQHLFPRLDEHGLQYETVETDDGAVTAMWIPPS